MKRVTITYIDGSAMTLQYPNGKTENLVRSTRHRFH